MKYIIEICVAIDLAILGIAYPLIVTEINKIGEKYKSNYLLEIFKSEVPQKQISFPSSILDSLPKFLTSISRFKFYLLLTISSFVFLILDIKPVFNFWLINNSASKIVFILTIILVFNFILWLDIVSLYKGKTIKILQHIIEKFKTNPPDSNISKYCLMTINEFAYYSIRSQDAHIQQELLDFYYYIFDRERKDFNESIIILETDSSEEIQNKQQLKKQGVRYRSELYDLVYTINLELIETNNIFVKAIEHQATSGWWLYGKGYEEVTISNRTYEVIWRILKFSINKPYVIKSYWSKAHQYFRMGLDYIMPEYEGNTLNITNQNDIDFRNEERVKFLEFHYVLGGLLLYAEEYKTLKYVLTFSQSSPPNYVLLPQSMTDIFKWYNNFRNVNGWNPQSIDTLYPYPELDNYGVSSQINLWICQYINILFIRQFSLIEFMTYHDHTGKPNLPEGDILELRKWKESINHFELSFNKVIKSHIVFKELGYLSLISDKKEEMLTYISELKEDIKSKIDDVELNRPLSDIKISDFLNHSERIIEKGISQYKLFIQDYNINTIYDKLKLTLNGSRSLTTKAAFVDGDIPHFNFEGVLAQWTCNKKLDFKLSDYAASF